jgi:hypothetical protein
MFNRIKSGTAEMGSNKVVIVKGNTEDNSTPESFYFAELNSGESAKLPYETDYLELKVNHINLSANPAYADITIKTACVTNCGATLDTWTGIHGNAIADLMAGTNNLTKTPDMSECLGLGSLLESPSNVGENYGIHVKGWLVPPVTGNYEFWIASDDNGEFWLSTDKNPANKAHRCSCDFASSRQWDKYPQQKSMPITLVAGKAYYYEVCVCPISINAGLETCFPCYLRRLTHSLNNCFSDLGPHEGRL